MLRFIYTKTLHCSQTSEITEDVYTWPQLKHRKKTRQVYSGTTFFCLKFIFQHVSPWKLLCKMLPVTLLKTLCVNMKGGNLTAAFKHHWTLTQRGRYQLFLLGISYELMQLHWSRIAVAKTKKAHMGCCDIHMQKMQHLAVIYCHLCLMYITGWFW